MKNRIFNYLLFSISFLFYLSNVQAQQRPLGIKEAEQIALTNYGTIKSKTNQLNSGKSNVSETKAEQLPDLTVSAQNVYGTVNEQDGPVYGFNGLATAASGPVLANQNWNAAFGSLYLSNVNWNFFAFGRAREKVAVQQRTVDLDITDLAQEEFEEQVRVASSYLNVLVAQQLIKAQEDNLYRTQQVQTVVRARVKNGLNPGVDSSLANAEVANAAIALTNAQENEKEQETQLAQFLGINSPTSFLLDTTFVSKAPNNIYVNTQMNPDDHPVLRYYRNRIGVSDEEAKYLSTFSYPTFTLFGLYQGRGSGFPVGYNTNLSDFNSSYGAGADPTRYNYLFGVGVTWDITNPFRVHYQVKSQKYLSQEYQDDYDQQNLNIHDQQTLAETKIVNAVKNYNEAPFEVKAANDAYGQKFALYKNGLANIVDLTQALYTLNRAEVDQDIASNGLWQALLYKSAAVGDFGIFINNF